MIGHCESLGIGSLAGGHHCESLGIGSLAGDTIARVSVSEAWLGDTIAWCPRIGRGLRPSLFRAVVLEVDLRGLAGLDGHFLRLGAVLLVPAFARVLPRGPIVD